MRQQYGFDFDPGRCVQCHACETACKSLHKIEPSVRWRRVVDLWEGEFPNVANRSFSLACHHCAEPACLQVCPTGAISKRYEDGIVVIDQEKCIGCHTCLMACPFGAPRFGTNGRMQKCHLCFERLEKGKEPACVATCPAEALFFGTMEELADLAAKRAAVKLSSLVQERTSLGIGADDCD